jgi:hypothetical protein
MEINVEKRTLYKIKIQGPLDNFSAIWNGNISILCSEKDKTLLACQLLDQAALRGFLNQLWNLNFTILTVERIENNEY